MYRKFSLKSIAVFILVISIIVGVVISFVPISELAIVERTVKDMDDDKETASNIETRLITYEHYWDELAKSPIFGQGFRYFRWIGNDEYLLQREGLHLSDVGIMGFFIKTGLVGMIWLMAGLLRLVVEIMKSKELPVAGAYIMLSVTTMGTLDLIMGQGTIFMFALFLGIMSNELMQSQHHVTNK